MFSTLATGSSPAREPRLEIGAAQQLEHAVGAVDDVLDEIDRLDDVRVAQPVDRVGFLEEPRDRLLAARQLLAQHLDRDVAVELRVARDVDVAHPALAEQTHEAIGAELLAEAGRRIAGRWHELRVIERARGLAVDEAAAAGGTALHLNGSIVPSRLSFVGAAGVSTLGGAGRGCATTGAPAFGFSNVIVGSGRSGTIVCVTSTPSANRATSATGAAEIGIDAVTGD